MRQYPENGTLDLMAFDAGTNGGISFQSPVFGLDPYVPMTYFDAQNASNIFFHKTEKKLHPICKAKLMLRN